jgi:hypothetical protein
MKQAIARAHRIYVKFQIMQKSGAEKHVIPATTTTTTTTTTITTTTTAITTTMNKFH